MRRDLADAYTGPADGDEYAGSPHGHEHQYARASHGHEHLYTGPAHGDLYTRAAY